MPEPDPARASEVEVTFAPGGAGTRVELSHSRFERHCEGAQGYAQAMGSEQGWPYLLACFARQAAST